MSIASTTSRNNYTGNNTASVFAYNFRILDEDHLLVTVRNTSDAETTLTIATDYTVSGVGASSGSVTLVSGGQAWLTAGKLTTDYVLSIRRVVPLTQPTDIRNQGTFYPEVHEDALDRVVMQLQDLSDQIGRSAIMAETIDPADFDPNIPADVMDNPGAALIVNATGTGWTVGTNVLGDSVVTTPYSENFLLSSSAASGRLSLGFSGTGGTVQAANMDALSIATAAIQALAVTTAKIAANAVTIAKMDTAIRTKLSNWAGTAGGSSSLHTLTIESDIAAYYDGMQLRYYVPGGLGNTGALTVNVNSIGGAPVYTPGAGALAGGEIADGHIIDLVYSATIGAFTYIRGVVPNEEIWLYTHAGFGATDTKIPYFTTTGRNTASTLVLVNDSTNGCKVTIVESGLYTISYTARNSETLGFGVTLNSAQLTTAITSCTPSTRIAFSPATAPGITGLRVAQSVTTYLTAGDIVRPHSDGDTDTTAQYESFRIVRVR